MIDSEIVAQIADGREKTRRELREELEGLFKKERESLLERAQLITNFAKWSGGAVILIFGLLGIKALSDVKTNVEEYFKNELEKAYRIADPASPLTRSIDQLIDRAVINALYMQTQRERDSGNARSRLSARDSTNDILTSGELERLIRILKSPSTGGQAFEDAIYVLNVLATAEDRRQAVSSALAELLGAKTGSGASWMSTNESKRLAILQSFRNSEAVDAVAGELLLQPVSTRIKSAALSRIRKESYKAAVPSLVQYIDAVEEPRAKFDGFITLARLRPDHERTRQFILNDMIKRTEKNELLHCVEVAAALVASTKERSFVQDTEKREKDRRMLAELAIPLVAKAFESGVTMTYNRFDLSEGINARIPIGPKSHRMTRSGGEIREIYTDDFLSDLLSFAASKSASVLAQYIFALSFDAELPEPAKRRVRVTAALSEGSYVRLKNGTVLRQSSAKGGAVELAADASNQGPNVERKVFALWEDPSGRRFQERLDEIANVTIEVKAILPKRGDDEVE